MEASAYELLISRPALRELRSIPAEQVAHIKERTGGLASDPWPRGVKKLSTRHGGFGLDRIASYTELTMRRGRWLSFGFAIDGLRLDHQIGELERD